MREDTEFMKRAVELALQAEREGNLPIGAVIAAGDDVVAEGRSAIWAPRFDATRHAEIEALRGVPSDLWRSPEHLSLYTTLEPCPMCLGSILLHRVPRIVFGSPDPYGGASTTLAHLPTYFQERYQATQWLGPIMRSECDPLYLRLMELVRSRGGLV